MAALARPQNIKRSLREARTSCLDIQVKDVAARVIELNSCGASSLAALVPNQVNFRRDAPTHFLELADAASGTCFDVAEAWLTDVEPPLMAVQHRLIIVFRPGTLWGGQRHMVVGSGGTNWRHYPLGL
jgi:hypothetical protein